MLDAIEGAFAPYVKDRGLDWEIHIEQVMTQQWPSVPQVCINPCCMHQWENVRRSLGNSHCTGQNPLHMA